tara:strand:+ start:1398 stop:2849 length:1452 start_codon:yes stop_codon:yes gene_type:complete
MLKNKTNFIYYFLILITVFIFQGSSYNFETLDWDVNAFLVTSLEFGRGNLPYENQYENKPPLLFFIFYIFSIISNSQLLIIKILNDLVIFLIVIQTIFIFKKKGTKVEVSNLLPGFLFILFTSNNWFHASYSEYIALVFIVSSYIIYKKNFSDYKFFLIGLFLGMATLINLGTFIFLGAFFVIYFLNQVNNVGPHIKTLLGFGSVHLIFLVLYFINGLIDEYMMAMINIPLSYAETDFSFISNLTIFFKSFSAYNFLIYFILLLCISLIFYKILYSLKRKKLNTDNYEILVFNFFAILFYFLAGKGYYHHLIFSLYFLSLTIIWIKNSNLQRMFLFSIIFVLLFSLNQFKDLTYNNFLNIENLEDNYPLKKAANQIIKNNIDYDSIFSTDNILILYYLDRPNASYVVHPALYDYQEITSVLIEFNKISENEKNEKFSLNLSLYEGDFFENNLSLEYSKVKFDQIDNFLINFWSKSKTVNIYSK